MLNKPCSFFLINNFVHMDKLENHFKNISFKVIHYNMLFAIMVFWLSNKMAKKIIYFFCDYLKIYINSYVHYDLVRRQWNFVLFHFYKYSNSIILIFFCWGWWYIFLLIYDTLAIRLSRSGFLYWHISDYWLPITHEVDLYFQQMSHEFEDPLPVCHPSPKSHR